MRRRDTARLKHESSGVRQRVRCIRNNVTTKKRKEQETMTKPLSELDVLELHVKEWLAEHDQAFLTKLETVLGLNAPLRSFAQTHGTDSVPVPPSARVVLVDNTQNDVAANVRQGNITMTVAASSQRWLTVLAPVLTSSEPVNLFFSSDPEDAIAQP